MLPRGHEIDVWVIEQALGRGGMGSVYRCHNRSARRILAAIKVLDLTLNTNASIRARFVREAEILFSLDHPHIVKVRNVRIDGPLPYLEMEFIEGESLESRIEGRALALHEVLRIGTQIAGALVYLHGRGIRHRDIKPSNILVQPDGNVKLVDFGIATELAGNTLSEGGQVFGSVAFVPPEWARAGELDPVGWDIYALGVCLYEAMTGQRAFDIATHGSPGQRFFQVIMAKQNHPPLDPGPEFPASVRTLIRELTDADPKKRLQTAALVLSRMEELSGVSQSSVTLAPTAEGANTSTPLPSRYEGRFKASYLLAGGAGMLLLGGLFLGIPALMHLDRASPPLVTHRPVLVEVLGLGDYPVHIEIKGLGEGLASDKRNQFQFEDVPLGSYVVQATLGKNCKEEPATCGKLETSLEVAGPITGEDHVVYLPWTMTPPDPRNVTLTLTGGKSPSLVELENTTRALPLPLLPGSYALTVGAGDCSTRDPARCSLLTDNLVVEWGAGDLLVEWALAEPTPPATPPGSATPHPDSTPRSARPPVSNHQLASWLSAHPEWQKDQAIAEGRADKKFLSGWDGATPPAGKENNAATSINWQLANAYCAGRGGLSGVDAEPLTWTEGPGWPWHEYRQQNGQPAWRRKDGTPGYSVTKTETSVSSGFRCRQ